MPIDSDLTVRAARLLQAESGCAHGVDIHLVKRLPMGGGLGGGSSDAATVLLALNHLWQLGLSRLRLQEIGLQLGADVPVFIFGENAFAEGLGEALQPVDVPPAWYVVLEPLCWYRPRRSSARRSSNAIPRRYGLSTGSRVSARTIWNR